ncbi:MAG: hypothetical protein DMG70_06545, partial [Acidobacteria bacterium]
KGEELVGMVMERSVEMVVGMLGVLKAGGAYVPVDPGYPEKRKRYMLEDAGVRIVLTQERFASVLANSGIASSLAVVALDADWDEINLESQEDLNFHAEMDHPVYVIYTSGSTGFPKGVVITQDSLRNHMLWMQREYPMLQYGSFMLLCWQERS